MSLWIDLKYIRMLPLERITDKGNNRFNFRCPICRDSAKNKSKKRGWIFTQDNHFFFKCFNCGNSSTLKTFIRNYFYDFYNEYMQEKITDGGLFSSSKEKPKQKNKNVLELNDFESLSLQQLKDLPINHDANLFLNKRKIPKEKVKDFYYTDDFYRWIKTIKPKLFNSVSIERRIIIPFYNKFNNISMIQARSIDGKEPKYITVKFDEETEKIFGIEKIDWNKTVYVLEGPLDSLFIENSVAFAGSLASIDSLLKYTNKENIIIIPDNDKRNFQTEDIITNIIVSGYKVVIWQNHIKFKDINEAIENGFTMNDIMSYINSRTFSDLRALTEFKLKRF